MDAIFHTEPPMSPGEQREAFQTALREGLEGACGLEMVQAVHERLSQRIEQHREEKGPEPLAVTEKDVAAILLDCGVEETFCAECGELFGEGAALSPANLIDGKRFEVKTADAAISLHPEHSCLVETRIIDGKKYLPIPAGEGLEVNGMPMDWAQPGSESTGIFCSLFGWYDLRKKSQENLKVHSPALWTGECTFLPTILIQK